MTTTLWLVAAFACAQLGAPAEPAPEIVARDVRGPEESNPPSRPAASKIVAVTVYQGQALVTREVSVPEGEGTVELLVTPLPPQTVDGSLHSEGTDSLRVLSTRFRTRAVKDDTRQDVRDKEELLKKLRAEAQRLGAEIAVQDADLQYLQKLEGFTATAGTGLTKKRRLESEPILSLSRFVMETRAQRSKAQTAFRQQLQAGTESAEFAQRQLAELSAGSSRIERDAVIVVQKARREAGTVRFGYLVGAAGWAPQYRLRAGSDNEAVRLEYLAAVVQQTGETWPDVRVTLSTARPALDAAPPDLMPLKMALSGALVSAPIEAEDDRSQKIAHELDKLIDIRCANETPLEDVIKSIARFTVGPDFPEGIPIYLDPAGLQQAGKTRTSPIVIDLAQVPLRTSLKLLLEQLGLAYQVRDGILKITAIGLEDAINENDVATGGGLTGGIGGMLGMGVALEGPRGATGTTLNQEAASEQVEELRVSEQPASPAAPDDKAGPSITFAVAGRLDIPSRKDPHLLEVARVVLPAEFYAKAVPVLTPRVYRLAKLTNKSELVLLPGEATVLVGDDFVGRMRLPLVAAGEPFIAGFGVDPQVQVSRRLIRKERSVQGANQIFTYEFRIGVRNYRAGAVRVQVWDRLPRPQGESVAVHLVKTSAELSTDALYQRTARLDNLMRWDLDVPAGTIGDKTMYLNYEFRLEYARDLPQPRFVSGSLLEATIGGGAMGAAMGGMGGGFRAVRPEGN